MLSGRVIGTPCPPPLLSGSVDLTEEEAIHTVDQLRRQRIGRKVYACSEGLRRWQLLRWLRLHGYQPTSQPATEQQSQACTLHRSSPDQVIDSRGLA
jgi:hypothetical protein